MAGIRVLRTLIFAAGSVGGLSGAAYGLLIEQSKRARSVISRHKGFPLNADGVYLPHGAGPFNAVEGSVLSLAMLGDSLAAGIGSESVDRLPGVLLATGLAEESGRPVRLITHAISGAKTFDLPAQVNRTLITRPDLAIVIVGGNDVTSRTRLSTSAALLGKQVSRLLAAGITVVMATCPDLGTVAPIPQPLREIARRYSLSLARLQRREMDRLGVRTVPLADLVSPEFQARPDELFSPDRFHPNGAGYEFAASVLLPTLCAAAGVSAGGLPLAAA